MKCNTRRGLLHYLVISRAEELYEAEAVTERVRHEGKATPIFGSNLRFNERPACDRPLNSRFDVVDDEVEMDWRPVSPVGSAFRRCARHRRTRRLRQ